MSNKVVIDFPGHDQIIYDPALMDSQGAPEKPIIVGCLKLENLLNEMRAQHGSEVKSWPLPIGHGHVEMLVRELILKARGEWEYPYQEIEICHCRSVSTETVDQAILAGCHTVSQIKKRSSASTACGTCQPDIEKILKLRLG